MILIALCCLSPFLVLPACASTTTINVTGNVLPETCDIEPGNLNQSVSLGEYRVTNFSAAGEETKQQSFSFIVKNCTAGIKAAKIKFSGTSAGNSDLFTLSSGNQPVADIGLALYSTAYNKQVEPNETVIYKLQNGANTLGFAFSLKSISDSVTAASLNGTITVDIEYE